MTVHTVQFTVGFIPGTGTVPGRQAYGSFKLVPGATGTMLLSRVSPMGEREATTGWTACVIGAPEYKNMVFSSTGAAESKISEQGGTVL